MPGPSSLHPWVNLVVVGNLDEKLAEWCTLPAVPFDEITRRLYAEVEAFAAEVGKPPPPMFNERSVRRWCDIFGIHVPRWNEGPGR